MSRYPSAPRALRACPAKPMFESLEGRRLLSAAAVAGLDRAVAGAGAGRLEQAVSLGAIGPHSKAAASGNVGNGVADAAYSFDVTAPLTLKVKLSKLRQDDRLSLLFADGEVIHQADNGRASSLQLVQRLDPGQYFLDVANGAADGAGSSRAISKHHPKPTTGFKLSLKAGRPGAAPCAGGPGHPVIRRPRPDRPDSPDSPDSPHDPFGRADLSGRHARTPRPADDDGDPGRRAGR